MKRRRARSLRGAPGGRFSALRGGAAKVALGLGFFGVSTYVFTAVVLRALGPQQFADFNLFWGLAYGLGLGAMLPFEQEVSRRVATARHTDGQVGAIAQRWASLACAFSLFSLLAVLPFVLHTGRDERRCTLARHHLLLPGARLGLRVARCTLRADTRWPLQRVSWWPREGPSASGGVSVLRWGRLPVVVRRCRPSALAAGVAITWRRDERLVRTSLQSLMRDVATAMAPLLVASLISLTLVNLGPVAIRYVEDCTATGARRQLPGGGVHRPFADLCLCGGPGRADAAASAERSSRRDAADFKGHGAPRLVPTVGLGLPGSCASPLRGPWLLRLLAGSQYDLPRDRHGPSDGSPTRATCSHWCCSRPQWRSDSHRASAVVWVLGP